MDDYNLPKYFRIAKMASKLSDHTKYQLGAVIVKSGRILSFGCNQKKSHPGSPFCGLHAEMSAIRNCDHDLAGASMYVFRQRKDGSLGISKPCKHCERLIRQKKLKRVYFTVDKFPFWDCEYL